MIYLVSLTVVGSFGLVAALIWDQVSASACTASELQGISRARVAIESFWAREVYVFAAIHILDARAQPGDETGTTSTRHI
jgi:hypothetical protein